MLSRLKDDSASPTSPINVKPPSVKATAFLNSNAIPFGSSRCSSTISIPSGVVSRNSFSRDQECSKLRLYFFRFLILLLDEKKINDLQAENSKLLMENIRLSQQLRRHGISQSSQPSPPFAHASSNPGSIPLRRSDSGISDHSTSRSGSIADLRSSSTGHRLCMDVTTDDDLDMENNLSISPLRLTS